MNRRFFITATDTDVGKTLVTTALMIAMQDRGIRCAPVKPVQTGTITGDDDFATMMSFARPPFTADEQQHLRMVQLPLPASPHLAARQSGMSITVQSLEQRISTLSNDWNVLLIEGAGGLLVPLNETETMLDLIKALHASPIVVTRDTLGTLNHTALTLRALAAEGISLAAVVITSATPPGDETDRLIRSDNVREITRRISPVPVVVLPHLAAINRDALLAAGRILLDAVLV